MKKRRTIKRPQKKATTQNRRLNRLEGLMNEVIIECLRLGRREALLTASMVEHGIEIPAEETHPGPDRQERVGSDNDGEHDGGGSPPEG